MRWEEDARCAIQPRHRRAAAPRARCRAQAPGSENKEAEGNAAAAAAADAAVSTLLAGGGVDDPGELMEMAEALLRDDPAASARLDDLKKSVAEVPSAGGGSEKTRVEKKGLGPF